MKFSEDCRDTTGRRARLRERELNGIDYVEVSDDQKVVTLRFINRAPTGLAPENVLIKGGVRVRDVRPVKVWNCDPDEAAEYERDDCVRVEVNHPGDFSTYTLCLVNARDGRPTDEPLEGFDPRYSCVTFSFKVNCPSDLDCKPACASTNEARPAPEIDYLAKDYASFRRLILDRLSLVTPAWQEGHAADLGVALVELLAYVGDHLSYYQDAVATEAYLDTARQRVSVRRHAAHVDYHMHEGCNARVWVHVETDTDLPFAGPRDVYFITGFDSVLPSRDVLTREDLQNVSLSAYEVFEPLALRPRTRPRVFAAHNRISFYTWGERECCLPRGATSAALRDAWASAAAEEPDDSPDAYEPEQQDKSYAPPQTPRQTERGYTPPPPPPPPPRERRLRLAPGDVLIFEEVLGPRTGEPADADPSHRHAVRLTRVEQAVDPLYDQPVVLIEWAAEDALPFALCVSTVGRAPECEYLTDVSVALGNIILCDHGRSVSTTLGRVPPADEEDAGCVGPGEPRDTRLRPGLFRPRLKQAPLTHGAPFPPPTSVARQQALYLDTLMARVREHVRRLLDKVRDGHALDADDLKELARIFGGTNLRRAGLRIRPSKTAPPQTPDEQAAALTKLVESEARLLARKARRVGILRARAAAGYVLGDAARQEVGEYFGQDFADALDARNAELFGPASIALRQEPGDALPRVVVKETPPAAAVFAGPKANAPVLHRRWSPRQNLIRSGAGDRHFVVETDNDGRARLRFGNGELGRAPGAGSTMKAVYRVGNGTAGNVGAEAVSKVVFRKREVSGVSLRVRNPLPARGGAEPEPAADVKTLAPGAFRAPIERAVTADDYATLAPRGAGERLQRAAARLRWTGSWNSVQVALDAAGTEEAGAALLEDVGGALQKYRRIGHDVQVEGARYVPLEIALEICVLPQHLRAHVKARLLEVLSDRVLPDGRRGLFHPDNLSFGEAVHLSRVVAAAQAVPGVESVQVRKFQRQFELPNREIENGVLPLGPLEVARLRNDANFPEQGQLTLDLRGGR